MTLSLCQPSACTPSPPSCPAIPSLPWTQVNLTIASCFAGYMAECTVRSSGSRLYRHDWPNTIPPWNQRAMDLVGPLATEVILLAMALVWQACLEYYWHLCESQYPTIGQKRPCSEVSVLGCSFMAVTTQCHCHGHLEGHLADEMAEEGADRCHDCACYDGSNAYTVLLHLVP